MCTIRSLHFASLLMLALILYRVTLALAHEVDEEALDEAETIILLVRVVKLRWHMRLCLA